MPIKLPKNAGTAIRGDHRGESIRCEEGIIWLTQADDPVDYFLHPTELFLIQRKGTVLIDARRDASFSLLPASLVETGHVATD